MTLLHIDSLRLGDHVPRYNASVSANIARQATGGRFNDEHILIQGNLQLTKTITPTATTIITGFAFKTTTQSAQVSFWADTNVRQHITVVFTTTNLVEVRLGASNGTLLTSASIAPQTTTDLWNYAEISVLVSDTVGNVKVRINGSSTNLIDFNGDTRNLGTSTNIDAIRLGGVTSANARFSDWYILNTSGGSENNFLGDIRIYPLRPSVNGNSSQLVGTDGNSTDNYLKVSEAPANTYTYNYSATSGNKDTYAMQDLPANVATVIATQETAVAAKSDSGTRSGKQVIRVSSTDYATASITLTTTFTLFSNIRTTDPATTAAWTVSGVNGIEAGWEVA